MSTEQTASAPAEASEEQTQSAPTLEESGETTEASDASEGKEAEPEAKDGDQAEEQVEEKPKKKSGVEKRIDKLTKQRETERLEKEYWKSQALKQGQNPASDQSAQKSDLISEAKPKSDDFETAEAYYEALAEWKVDQRIKAQEAKVKENELKSEFQKKAETYAEKATAFAKDNPDFEDVVAEADDVNLSATVQDAILRHGPELAYELAKDVAELERICKLSAIEAAEEIGLIRARIRGAKTDSKIQPKLTNAPKPPTPIQSNSAPVRKTIYDAGLSFADYERLRNEQLRRKA